MAVSDEVKAKIRAESDPDDFRRWVAEDEQRATWSDIDHRYREVIEDAWQYRIACALQETLMDGPVSPAVARARTKIFPAYDQEFWDSVAWEE